MTMTGKEIIMLSAILAENLTKDMSLEQMQVLKLFISQLHNDINTLYGVKLIKNSSK
jgi:hypothetical protein